MPSGLMAPGFSPTPTPLFLRGFIRSMTSMISSVFLARASACCLATSLLPFLKASAILSTAATTSLFSPAPLPWAINKAPRAVTPSPAIHMRVRFMCFSKVWLRFFLPLAAWRSAPARRRWSGSFLAGDRLAAEDDAVIAGHEADDHLAIDVAQVNQLGVLAGRFQEFLFIYFRSRSIQI